MQTAALIGIIPCAARRGDDGIVGAVAFRGRAIRDGVMHAFAGGRVAPIVGAFVPIVAILSREQIHHFESGWLAISTELELDIALGFKEPFLEI